MDTPLESSLPVPVRRRTWLAGLLRACNLTHIGVEVGSHRGGYAKYLLERWPGILYMVDPWVTQPADVYDDPVNSRDREADYAEAMRQTAAYDQRRVVYREMSETAAEHFLDESVDFVYIDGNHAQCDKDIAIWWPKVRPGGILAGHDYTEPGAVRFASNVKEAVDSFVAKNELPLRLTQEKFATWFVFKPVLPKRIHQIWLGSRPLRQKYVEWGKRFQELHPGWEYRLWREPPPEFLQAYTAVYSRAPNRAVQADLLRYWLIYNYGGFYFDTDCEPLRNLEPFRAYPVMAALATPDRCGNAVLGGVAGNEFYRLLLLRAVAAFNPKNSVAMLHAYVKLVNDRRDLCVRIPQPAFFPVEYKKRKQLRQHIDRVDFSLTYAIHHFDATWHKWTIANEP